MSRAARPSLRLVSATLVAVLVALVGLVAAGCGDETRVGGDESGVRGSTGDRVPITSRAVAAVVVEHFPGPTSAAETYEVGDRGPGAVGADVRYRGDGEYDGDLVSVVVGKELGYFGHPCPPESCAQWTTPAGTFQLTWALEVPEEDPGFVSLLLDRGDAQLYVGSSGERITADPRELDLQVDVAQLQKLLEDPRLGTTTTPETIDAGRDLDVWQ